MRSRQHRRPTIRRNRRRWSGSQISCAPRSLPTIRAHWVTMPARRWSKTHMCFAITLTSMYASRVTATSGVPPTTGGPRLSRRPGHRISQAVTTVSRARNTVPLHIRTSPRTPLCAPSHGSKTVPRPLLRTRRDAETVFLGSRSSFHPGHSSHDVQSRPRHAHQVDAGRRGLAVVTPSVPKQATTARG